LAKLLRTGVDPAGRSLGQSMPKYELSDRDMAILIHYLKQLSSADGYSPGVTDSEIRFATIVTDDVSEQDSEAMLNVLRAHIRTRNTETRPHQRRATRAPFYKTELYSAYRRLTLDVWRLKGHPDTWPDQLWAYYDERPVFALLGGISGQSWETIHQFCEEQKLPAILPITEQPHISDSAWYTLYFSRGLYQEGESAADFLMRSEWAKNKKIVQLFDGSHQSRLLASAFLENWRGPGSRLTTINLADKSQHQLSELVSVTDKDTVLVVWAKMAPHSPLLQAIQQHGEVDSILLSYGLVGDGWREIMPDDMDRLYITIAQSLPGENEKRARVVKRWLQREGIPITNFDIQAKMYFIGWLLPGALRYMRSEFYRDYFMEGFDMMRDQNSAIAVYPRLSFSPGQRYLAKGAYVATPSAGNSGELIKLTNWATN
ncbi:MAG: hypothetical protein MI754_08685, partial [Chromatiales bacterium]|nr:hypothetical protein [Chromatiales bacterium]